MNEKGLLAGDCCSCPVPPPRRAQDWEEGGGRVSSANKDAFLCWAFQLSALSLVFRRVCLGLKGPRRSKSLAKPAPSPPVSAQRPAGQEAAVSRRWRSGTAQPLSPTAVRRPGLGDKFQGVCSDFLGDFSIRSITFSSRQKSIPVPEVVEGARTRALRISRGPRAPGAWARAGNQYAWGGRCAWLGGGPVWGRLNETFGRGWQGMAGEKDRDLFCQGRGPLVCCWFLGCTPFPAPRSPRACPAAAAPSPEPAGAPCATLQGARSTWRGFFEGMAAQEKGFLAGFTFSQPASALPQPGCAAAGKELGSSSRSTQVRVERPQGTPFAPRLQTRSRLPEPRARAISRRAQVHDRAKWPSAAAT